MPTAEEFVQQARSAGYGDEEIENFLMRSKKMNPKIKTSLEILRRSGTGPSAQTKNLAFQAGGQLDDDGGSSALGTLGRIGGTALATYAAGGPIAAAIGTAGQALSEMSAGEQPQEGGQPEGQEQAASSMAGFTERIPSPEELLKLFNAYKRGGGTAAFSEFAKQQLGKGRQAEEPKQERQAGGQPPKAEGQQLPKPILDIAMQKLQVRPDPSFAATTTAAEVLSPQHPLRNLARTFQKRSGQALEEAILEQLSAQSPEQQQGQQAQPQAQQQQAQAQNPMAGMMQAAQQAPQAGGMAQGAAQGQGMDLSQLSDAQIMQLMKRRGLL